MQSGVVYHNEIRFEEVPGDFHLLFEREYLVLRCLKETKFCLNILQRNKKGHLQNREIINRKVDALIFDIS